MKLPVPYHSQFLDVHDYTWNIRSCSGASVAMVLEYFTKEKIDILEFMKEAENSGGYSKTNGIVHDYVITYFQKKGLTSWRYKNPETKDILDTLEPVFEQLRNNNPVIVSINKIVLEQKKFHNIVVVGYEENESKEITHLYYHEPEATVEKVEGDTAIGGAFRCCDVETFKTYWRGRAIFVSK